MLLRATAPSISTSSTYECAIAYLYSTVSYCIGSVICLSSSLPSPCLLCLSSSCVTRNVIKIVTRHNERDAVNRCIARGGLRDEEGVRGRRVLSFFFGWHACTTFSTAVYSSSLQNGIDKFFDKGKNTMMIFFFGFFLIITKCIN